MLKEGWYNTEKYGEVYVSPSGKAWIVNKDLRSVCIPLEETDITSKTRVEKLKHALIQRKSKANIALRVTKGLNR